MEGNENLAMTAQLSLEWAYNALSDTQEAAALFNGVETRRDMKADDAAQAAALLESAISAQEKAKAVCQALLEAITEKRRDT